MGLFRRRSRSGSGGGLFPIPHYTRRTRSGGRVSVGGCCLPIPLAVLGAVGIGARVLARR